MAYTQTDLDAIEAAMASGVLRVRDRNGSEIQYRNFEDMRRARDLIREELGLVENAGITVMYPSYRKGTDTCG